MELQRQVTRLAELVLAGVPDGSILRAVYIKAAPRVQQRVAGAEKSEALIEQARGIRTEKGMPFWHALFLAGERSSGGVPLEVLRSALYHQDPSNYETVEIRKSPAAAEALARMATGVRGRNAIALQSRVTLPSGEDRYIPMLDFTSKATRPGSESTVRSAVEALSMAGRLFASARSYHFYGSTLVSREEQLDFWARALLLTPIVDERWIAHQIRAQVGALRVSPNERGIVPEPLAAFAPERRSNS